MLAGTALAPLPQAHELHGQKVEKVQGGVPVPLANEAHHPIDANVNQTKKKRQDAPVGT